MCALGIAQITVWGTSNYCLGVLAKPIAADTRWSLSFVYLGFTVAVIAMSLVSAWVGRTIDRIGGRPVMTAGVILVSMGQYALSLVQTETQYLVVWAFLGVGMWVAFNATFSTAQKNVATKVNTCIGQSSQSSNC